MLTMDDDDDMPQLSTDTLKALQEFRLEQHEKELKLMEIMEQSNPVDISNLSFGEDWQLSQFWYSEETAISLAKAATAVVGYKGNIALISCPTLYKHIKSLAPDCKVSLLEYDNRFAITAGEAFVQYDYNFPLDVPRELASQCDLVVMDPPFLSEECLTKTSVTAKFLAKHKIVLCTEVSNALHTKSAGLATYQREDDSLSLQLNESDVHRRPEIHLWPHHCLKRLMYTWHSKSTSLATEQREDDSLLPYICGLTTV
ncbi:EEF1A lysine methyltransferase 1 [Homalodisca vitripennis]|nr:EEF1A lysine methyltransferase 1 [Homalodisca vitripennis]